MTTYSPIDLGENLEFGFSGPALSEGQLPALFYFALSAHDTLCLDPYNQPVTFLARRRLRIFSATLPFHEPPRKPEEALTRWAQAFEQGSDILTPFINHAVRAVDKIVTLGLAPPDKIGVAGLSRGAFIATHVAARNPLIRHILGFAPLMQLCKTREFAAFADQPLIAFYDIQNQIEHLIGKNLRFYIGNRDERVGSAACFSFIEQLADASYRAKIRSPQAELMIYPSVGYQGHGTPPTIFEQGAEWMCQKLEVFDYE